MSSLYKVGQKYSIANKMFTNNRHEIILFRSTVMWQQNSHNIHFWLVHNAIYNGRYSYFKISRFSYIECVSSIRTVWCLYVLFYMEALSRIIGINHLRCVFSCWQLSSHCLNQNSQEPLLEFNFVFFTSYSCTHHLNYLRNVYGCNSFEILHTIFVAFPKVATWL